MAMKYIKELELFQMRVYAVIGVEDLARMEKRLGLSQDPKELWLSMGSPGGLTLHDPTAKSVVVYLSDEIEWLSSSSYRTAAHEAYHAAEVIERNRDDEMGEETKAYIIGHIAQVLLSLLQRTASSTLERAAEEEPKNSPKQEPKQ